MSNYNKVRGILKAKEGLQFPRRQSIWDKILAGTWDSTTKDFTLFQNNPYITQGAGETVSLPSSENDEIYKTTNATSGTTNNQNGGQDGNSSENDGANFGKKVGSFFAKNPQIIGNTFDILGNSFGNNVTNSQGVNNAFALGDFAGNLAMKINPIAGIAVKGGMAALKGINDLGGKYSDDFSINIDTVAQVGGSYQGSVADFNIAQSKAGKKYGLFSNGSRKKANRQIREASRQQNIMTDIANENQNYLAMSGNDLNYLRYGFEQDGGYDQRYMRVAKQGTKLQGKIDFIKERRNKINSIINLDSKEIEWQPTIVEEIESFKEGGIIESSEEWTPTIVIEEWEPTIIEYKDGGTLEVEEWEPVIVVEEFQNGGKTRTLEELIEYAKKENPRFVQRFSEEPKGIEFIDNEGNEVKGSHYLEYAEDDNGAIVYPRIQEVDGELKYFQNWREALDNALKNNNILRMTLEEAKLFSESGEDEQGNLFGYKVGWPQFFKTFKLGGKTKEKEETPEIEETTQKNIIPEGALHKNKHHIEHTDGLTQKGIPVIDNDGQQQAEIECEEWTMTLELTKTIEKLYKQFYSEEVSQKEKDELAIEAGKLLVKEILYNTDDRVGLIEKCEKGGKL